MKWLALCFIALVIGMTVTETAEINQETGYFAEVPAEQIHTMRVYEDGSFEIVYKDQGRGQTSEIGCLPNGLCND